MLKLINIGWQSNRVVYVDKETKKFYISETSRHSNHIFFLVPIASTLLVGILFLCYGITFLISIFGKRVLIKQWSLQLYYPNVFQIRELLENGKKQRIGQLIIVGLMICFILLLSYDYLISGSVRPLLISTFLVGATSLLIWDCSPLDRRKVIRQLEKEYS
ncbi:hypothetical protein ACM0P9_05625 [Streptococcus pluranimalium]